MTSFVTTLDDNKIGVNSLPSTSVGDLLNATLSHVGEVTIDLGSITDTINIDVTSGAYFKTNAISSQEITVNIQNFETIFSTRSVTFILRINTTQFNSYFVFPPNGIFNVIPFGGSNPPIFEIPGIYHILFTGESGESMYYGKAGSY